MKLLKKWHCLTDSSFVASQELPSFQIVPAQARDSLQSWQSADRVFLQYFCSSQHLLTARPTSFSQTMTFQGIYYTSVKFPSFSPSKAVSPSCWWQIPKMQKGSPAFSCTLHLSRAKAWGDECLQRWQKTFDPRWHSQHMLGEQLSSHHWQMLQWEWLAKPWSLHSTPQVYSVPDMVTHLFISSLVSQLNLLGCCFHEAPKRLS